ncbi:MAG: phosphoglucosamine mutase [Candidatus Aureabacteria bacterium]|nr:phosphoglucosamine mutase [Candidatus Auribacterota bacterium]
MTDLIVSVSGLRGIFGESLNPEIALKYSAAFGHMIKGGAVVVGRDSRVSGQALKYAVISGLISTGCDVIDLGITPTPTVQIMTEQLGAAGGIEITASHNPAMWNGLKFMSPDGLFIEGDVIEKLKQLADSGKFSYSGYMNIGKLKENVTAVDVHISKVLAIPYIDKGKIQKRNFKVVVDPVNGAGAVIMPELLRKLGCEVVLINGEPDGHFAHEPEPLPENLRALSGEVVKNKADIGIAVDPDADRCAIVDEKGNPIGEENTLAIAVKMILSRKKGKVTVNVSTSMAIDDIAGACGCEVVRTKVGEINVASEMKKNASVIGGEGNGGVILPDVHLGRDAPVASALALQYLVESGKTLSENMKKMPAYFMVKRKKAVSGFDPAAVLSRLKGLLKTEDVDETDGLKIIRKKSWVQVRASNTEPIIRIYSEAQSREEAVKLQNEISGKIEELI